MIYQLDYKELLNKIEEPIPLLLTDPPYNISIESGFHTMEAKGIKTDFGAWDKVDTDYEDICLRSYPKISYGGTIIIFCSWRRVSDVRRALELAKFSKLRCGIWIKTNPVPTNPGVAYLSTTHEFFLTAVKGSGQTFNEWAHPGIFKLPKGHGKGKRVHPTQKPIKLINRLIEIHSNPRDLVVDPFCGSGTTGVSAIQLGRRFIGGDIMPEYIEITKERIKRL